VTEAEWLACEYPFALLKVVAPTADPRKLRLFVCACCARMLAATPQDRRLLRDYYAGSFEQLERALGVVEQFADGLVGADALEQAREDARDSMYVPGHIDYGGETGLWREVAVVAAAAAADEQLPKVLGVACLRAADGAGFAEEERWQAAVLRDVFGNPFRPVEFDPMWRTDTAQTLARHIYAAREFGTLPILADALQDAGCENEDVLNHCRDLTHVHVRGCWVLDAVLDKA
jgi:hypothetical protein